MGNAHHIVPGLLEFDKWVQLGIAIEGFMKIEEGSRPEDPMGMLRSYLMGDDIAPPTNTKREVN